MEGDSIQKAKDVAAERAGGEASQTDGTVGAAGGERDAHAAAEAEEVGGGGSEMCHQERGPANAVASSGAADGAAAATDSAAAGDCDDTERARREAEHAEGFAAVRRMHYGGEAQAMREARELMRREMEQEQEEAERRR